MDEEDSEREDEVEEYEKKYNFRFEEEGGKEVEGHDRMQPDSMRVERNKRKDKRQDKLERMKEAKHRA